MGTWNAKQEQALSQLCDSLFVVDENKHLKGGDCLFYDYVCIHAYMYICVCVVHVDAHVHVSILACTHVHRG